MSDQEMEPTRIGPAPGERTLGAGATLTATRGFQPPDPSRTQMAVAAICPVCKSTTPSGELYCGDCGFLLTTALAEPIEAPVEQAPPAELVDVETGRRYALRYGINTIGRQGTDVLSSADTVSRLHARIVVEEGGVLIEDLGSSNGTTVGDKKLGPNDAVNAAPGAPIRFGSWKVRIEPTSASIAAAQPTVIPTTAEKTLTDGSPAIDPGAPDAATAVLRKIEGAAPDITVTTGSITVGRRASNTIVLPNDIYVSGRHAEIVADGAGVYLIDLGSTNGTFVNGERLEAQDRKLLLEGDEARIGQSKFVFRASAHPAEPIVAGPELISDVAGPAAETEAGNVTEASEV